MQALDKTNHELITTSFGLKKIRKCMYTETEGPQK